MTEQEWLTSTHPWGMITFAESVSGKRKLRLLTCAFCRQVLNPFAPRFADRALTAAEAFADGEIDAAMLARVRERLARAFSGASDAADLGTGYLMHLMDACMWAFCRPEQETLAVGKASLAAARAAADVPWPATGELHRGCPAELAAQADLGHDIFGNPFRPVGLASAWLTADVIALARGMYASRDFSAMPILADALQDAGCDDEEILTHCRKPREHVRGCWVVDLLLGKK
jgi:hypothetical protein